MAKIMGAVVVVCLLALAGCEEEGGDGGSCCRVCDTGKACGDSCIDVDFTCSQPAGCACNGALPFDEEPCDVHDAETGKCVEHYHEAPDGE